MEKRQERSEFCKFLIYFQKIATIIKHLIASDRDVNWPLHVGAVKARAGFTCLWAIGHDLGPPSPIFILNFHPLILRGSKQNRQMQA